MSNPNLDDPPINLYCGRLWTGYFCRAAMHTQQTPIMPMIWKLSLRASIVQFQSYTLYQTDRQVPRWTIRDAFCRGHDRKSHDAVSDKPP